jgi:hypothetical protein
MVEGVLPAMQARPVPCPGEHPRSADDRGRAQKRRGKGLPGRVPVLVAIDGGGQVPDRRPGEGGTFPGGAGAGLTGR